MGLAGPSWGPAFACSIAYGGDALIRSILVRRVSLMESQPGTTDQGKEETRFDQSLKAIASPGDRRSVLSSLGVAGLALLASLGVGEAGAKGSKPGKGKSGKGKNKTPEKDSKGKSAAVDEPDANAQKPETDTLRSASDADTRSSEN